jgi:hypothetical protein
MFDPVLGGRIEIVRGRLSDERADQVRRFWASQGALDEATAAERLTEVVCVLLDASGEVAGVNSVYRSDLPLIGNRPFWIYRSLLLPEAAEAAASMIMVAFNALEAEFDPSADEPLGLCVLVKDPSEIARHPEAEWLWPWLFYAGYLEDGSQVRLFYFGGARVSRPRPVDARDPRIDRRYRIEAFAEQTKVDTDAIIDLWTGEGALPREEAERRVHEVLLVATDQARELAAVCTAYLQRNEQLGMDMWYVRVFTAAAHRMSGVATLLTLVARDHLQARFLSGLDTRGSGMVLEVENEYVKERFDDVIWFPLYSLYIGDNERGDHVRVHYFPGALAPAPPA